jgi:hypothetical protein
MKQLGTSSQRQKPMDRICDPGWIAVQRQSTVYSKLLHEGELVKGEAQWWISRTFWS